MNHRLFALCRAEDAPCATRYHVIFLFFNVRPTDGTMGWHKKDQCVLITLIQYDPYDFWDDIPCPSYTNSIANTHIFSSHFIFIMQRCVRDCHPTHKNRLQSRYWCDCASTPNLNINPFDNRKCLLCREFMGNCPSWRSGYKA